MFRQAARRVMKLTAASADLMLRPPHGLVVLIYHRVGGRTGVEVDLPRSLFADQVAFLAAECEVVTLAEGLRRVGASDSVSRDRPLVALTFDDGTADFADEAIPVLQEFHTPVTLYIATDFLEHGRSFPDDGVPLSWAALRDAHATGLVHVGSHTHTHALLDRLPAERIAEELDRSTELIEKQVGAAAEHFAYPKAVMGSPAADAAVRARFVSAAVAGCRANVPGHTDAFRLARSPVQKSDGMRWFMRKVRGGMGFEDTLRAKLNRRRYAGETT
jgi:peptidoglycan/xylan/chitin deacetylase (PgdA/CDA1 family)